MNQRPNLTKIEDSLISYSTRTFRDRIVKFWKVKVNEAEDALVYSVVDSADPDAPLFDYATAPFQKDSKFKGLEYSQFYSINSIERIPVEKSILTRYEEYTLQSLCNIYPNITYFMRNIDRYKNPYIEVYYNYMGNKFAHFKLPPIYNNQTYCLGMKLDKPYSIDALGLERRDNINYDEL